MAHARGMMDECENHSIDRIPQQYALHIFMRCGVAGVYNTERATD